MKVLVAGATGVVGRRVVPLLVDAGHEVWGSTRGEARFGQVAGLGARPVALDLLDRSHLSTTLESIRPDAVVHQVTDLSDRDFAANRRLRVEGAPNLVDAALAAGARRLVVQSVAWAYAPGTGPAAEREPLDLDGAGSHRDLATAVEALETAAERMPEWVALRYGLLYGPGTWYAPGGSMADLARRGRLTAGAGVTSFVHVGDAATVAVAALDWPSGAVNVVDDEPAPGREWVPVFARAVGAPPPPVDVGGEPWERGASNALAHRRAGWRLQHPSWRTGFASSG